MPIKIQFLTDVADVIRGAKKSGQALEDVADSLEDVGRAGEGIDVKVSESFKALGDEAAKGGKKAAEGAEDAARGSHEAIRTMSDETRSNISESVSSFRGDIEDIPQLMQDVAGGVVADLGPLGAVLGTAVAAGIGLAIAGLQANAEEVQKNKELVLELSQAIADAGGDLGAVDFEGRMQDWGRAIQDTKEWWEVFQDDAKTGFEVIQERAKKTGEDWTAAFRGTHGSMEESQAYLEDTGRTLEALNAKIDEAGTVTDEYGRSTSLASQDLLDARDALQQNRTEAEQNISTQQKAQAVQQASNELAGTATRTIGGLTEAQQKEEEATRRNTDAKQEQYDAVQALVDAQDRAVGKVADSITAENDWQQAIDDAAAAIKNNGATVDASTEKGRANRQMLVDMAGSARDNSAAQIAQGESLDAATQRMEGQRAKFIETAVAAGMSRDEAKKYADQLGLTPEAIKTTFQSNAADTKKAAEDYHAALDGMARTAVNERWQAEMAPYFAELDGRPPDQGFQRIAEIFHLD